MITIALKPAYLHRGGKGWSQDAEIIVTAADVEPSPFELPARIANGSLATPDGTYDNLLTIPLQANGPIALELELESGHRVRVQGGSVEVRLLGEPKFVEDVA